MATCEMLSMQLDEIINLLGLLLALLVSLSVVVFVTLLTK